MTDKRSYFDLQVNGYRGVDFNADLLLPDQLAVACEGLQADGVEGILATIITADLERMAERVRNLVQARAAVPIAEKLIQGIHLEGPFISGIPGYVGTHPVQSVRPASVDAMELLWDAAAGLLRLVTLAPEVDVGCKVTRWLADRDVLVSAGHCNASLDELRSAIDAGLSMVTHLGNGCPLVLNRHDNIIQRALCLADRLWICFIADGVHVPFTALGNYIKIAGVERTIVVSDAISAAGMGPGAFKLGDQTVVVDEQLATWDKDRTHLMGSAMTMRQADANLRTKLGMTGADARLVTSVNARMAMGGPAEKQLTSQPVRGSVRQRAASND